MPSNFDPFPCSPRLFGVLLLTALLHGTSAQAQEVRRDFSVAWPTVNAILLSGNTLYVAGNFYLIGPATGSAALVDETSGAVDPDFPRVAGRVITAVPDGAGGWFLGGQFTAVGGQPRMRLAHVLADHSVSSWNPGVDGGVSQLILKGSTLYVAGIFTHVGGVARQSIAALDAVTGDILPFDPNPFVFGNEYEPSISAMALRGDTLYVGGGFEQISGALRTGLAALDATSGACLPWNPGLFGVTAMTLTSTDLYVGDGSTVVDFDPASGAEKPWSVSVSGHVTAILPHGSTVYLAGSFGSIEGKTRSFLGAVDAGTGAVSDWNPGASYQVNALAVSGSTIYAGGGFSIVGGQTRFCVAAIDSVTGQATTWSPNMNAEVNVLVPDGPNLFVGGVFTSAGGEIRESLAALDATTGKLTPWKADIPGGYVHALAASGTTLYVGGFFDHVAGVARNNVAAVDMQTGAVLPWNPNADRGVYSIVPDLDTIYLGGFFSNLGGQTRNLLGAVDAISGNPTAWNPDVEMPAGTFPPVPHPPVPGVFKLLKSGSQVFVGGVFTTVAGQARHSLAAVDPVSALPTEWNPSAGRVLSTVYDMALSGNSIYVGGDFDSLGGESRKYLGEVDTSLGLATAWHPEVGSTVLSILPHGSTVYLSGSFLELGGEPRHHFGALDAASGLPTPWDPDADDIAFSLAIESATLFAGGEFTSVGGQPQSAIAAISIPDGAVPALISFSNAEVSSNRVVLHWIAAGGSDGVARVSRSEDSVTWSVLGVVTTDAAGELVYVDASVAPGHRYEYRLETSVNGREVFEGEASVQVPVAPLALYGPSTNPISARALSVSFSLASASPARITLYDVSGRRVLSREVGSLGAGYHELRLDSDRRIGPGVYLLQLSQSGRTFEKRSVVLP